MLPTLSNTMSRLGARGPKSHGTSKILDKWERYPCRTFPLNPTGHKANIPWPSPSCWYFLGFFRKSTNSTTSSGSWRANWKYKRKFTTNGGKKDHCFLISVFWGFFNCFQNHWSFHIFLPFWRPWFLDFFFAMAKFQKCQAAAFAWSSPATSANFTSAALFVWDFHWLKLPPCWCWQIYQIQGGPFNHLILILGVYDQPEVSCYFISLYLASRCPQLRRKKKKNRSGHNPIIGVPKKSIPKRSQQKKQTNHIEKKKATLLACFFPTGQGFHRWRLKNQRFQKKNIILTPQNNWSKKNENDRPTKITTKQPSPQHLGFHILGALWKDFTNIEDASTTGSRTSWHTLESKRTNPLRIP